MRILRRNFLAAMGAPGLNGPAIFRAHHALIALTCLVASQRAEGADALALSSGSIHLRSGNVAEWSEFAGQTPTSNRLDLRFTSPVNLTEATLFIRQDDVRQDWLVELNRKRLGTLFLMEADLLHTLVIPPGTLQDGENVLSVVPPKANDDIILNEVRIEPRPKTESLREATLSLRVKDGHSGAGLPCRLTIVNAQGALAPLMGLSNGPALSVRPGVVYTGDGRAEVGLPAGEYTVFASRGFEWTVATQRVQVAISATARLEFQLSRSVRTPGWVSCDTHVHTWTHSRHGDATLDERMVTLAGEGIELPIATDHNLNIDYTEAARAARVAEWFTPVVGNEVTTAAGHFNIFPVEPSARVPDFMITDWPRLMTAFRATPNVRVVVLNHPRNVHNKFQPFAATNFNAITGDNLRGPAFSFDAMEVINSSAQQSAFMLVYRDWFALLNHGYRITAVGSSDGHDVSRYIVGQGRTYISCPDEQPGRINVGIACSNLLAGRALVSMGLLVDLMVDERFRVGDTATNLSAEVRVTVQIQAPPWAAATNVCLFANGLKIWEQTFANAQNERVTWTIPRPTHDVHLVALATGPGISAPYWAIPRPYQPASPHWESKVIASTNPIWLDGDRDGRFMAAREYAKLLVNEHRGSAKKLIHALARFDQAVAAQAAGLWVSEGLSVEASELADALKSGASHVQRGFSAFVGTQH